MKDILNLGLDPEKLCTDRLFVALSSPFRELLGEYLIECYDTILSHYIKFILYTYSVIQRDVTSEN
jgi:hypothetical protein